jgi:Transposase and inactivated derivatives
MASTLTNLIVHIVFSTKNRLPLITHELQPKLYAYMGGITRGEGGSLIAIGGIEDHLHMLVRLPSTTSIAEMLRRIKGNSSHWVNEQHNITVSFGWQRGYAAFSVSQSLISRVTEYIKRQESHHKKITFKNELERLFLRNGVEYDERYVWR